MKKFIIFGCFFVMALILISNLSYGRRIDVEDYNLNNKDDLYIIIENNKVDYNNKEILDVLTNWYDYFEKEDMFLTSDGEYVDYVTYEIYRVHLSNVYKNDKKKILKNLLKYANYPKEEDSSKYEEYISEYSKTTGKEI